MNKEEIYQKFLTAQNATKNALRNFLSQYITDTILLEKIVDALDDVGASENDVASVDIADYFASNPNSTKETLATVIQNGNKVDIVTGFGNSVIGKQIVAQIFYNYNNNPSNRSTTRSKRIASEVCNVSSFILHTFDTQRQPKQVLYSRYCDNQGNVCHEYIISIKNGHYIIKNSWSEFSEYMKSNDCIAALPILMEQHSTNKIILEPDCLLIEHTEPIIDFETVLHNNRGISKIFISENDSHIFQLSEKSL